MSDTKDKIRSVVAAFAEAWNRHDMEAFAGLFAEDAEFVNVVGIWWRGRAEIKAAHEFTHSNMFKRSRLTIGETSIREARPGFAIARARWTLEGHVSPEGTELEARIGLLVFVLTSHDDTWSIIDAQNTDIIDGALSRPQ